MSGRLYACLMGVSEYQSGSIRALPAAVPDVDVLREFLMARAGLRERECLCLRGTAREGEGSLPRSRILKSLTDFTRSPMTEEDTFVLFYSGHGFGLHDGQGEWNGTCLCGSDAEPDHPELLRDTAITMETLWRRLLGIQAGQQIVILDMCQNDPWVGVKHLGDGVMSKGAVKDLGLLVKPAEPGKPTRRRRALLTSCWEGQKSYEYPKANRSWFLHHVLGLLDEEGRAEWALDQGWVERLGKRMKSEAWRELPQAAEQTPYLEVAGGRVRLRLRPTVVLGQVPGGGEATTAPTELILPVDVSVPEAEDPQEVEVELVRVQPIEVEVRQMPMDAGTVPGLPPVPEALLALEGTVAGYVEAIREMAAGTHPSLQPGREAVGRAEQQWQEMQAALDAHPAGLTDEEEARLAKRVVTAVREGWQRWDGLVREVPERVDPGEYLQRAYRLRNLERARLALVAAREDWERAQNAAMQRLREEKALVDVRLAARRETDLLALLEGFARENAEAEEFPLLRFVEFEKALRGRRHGIVFPIAYRWAQDLWEFRRVPPEARPFPWPCATRERPWENSLGMRFVPVPGVPGLVSTWITRVRDYEIFVRETGREWPRPDFPQTLDHPAVNASWEDAVAFCAWLTSRERKGLGILGGQVFRLLRDPEWSRAVGLDAEQGATPSERDQQVPGVFPWGSQWPPPKNAGNYADEAARRKRPGANAIQGYDDGWPETSPVGSFPANARGLFDLGGNCWEWVEDFYDGRDGHRALRGGSWGNAGPASLLSSYRHYYAPGDRSRSIGFRVVLATDDTAA